MAVIIVSNEASESGTDIICTGGVGGVGVRGDSPKLTS